MFLISHKHIDLCMALFVVINSYVIRCAFRHPDDVYMFCYIDVTLNIRYILWDVYRILAEWQIVMPLWWPILYVCIKIKNKKWVVTPSVCNNTIGQLNFKRLSVQSLSTMPAPQLSKLVLLLNYTYIWSQPMLGTFLEF
jgi:hypothetical protein